MDWKQIPTYARRAWHWFLGDAFNWSRGWRELVAFWDTIVDNGPRYTEPKEWASLVIDTARNLIHECSYIIVHVGVIWAAWSLVEYVKAQFA